MKKNPNGTVDSLPSRKPKRQIPEETFVANEILDRITDAFVALDKNGRCTYMNKKAAEIFERDPRTVIGKSILSEFPEATGQPFYKAYRKAMKEQKYVYSQEYYEPYDHWFESHIYPSPEGLSVFFRDITQRKKAEEELRMVHQRLSYHFTNSPLAVIEWDKNLVVTKWSTQAEHIFGWTEQEVLGKHFNELNLVFENDREYVMPFVNQLRDGLVDRNRIANRNNTKSGNVIYCEWYNSLLKDENGKVLSIMSLTQDVTENRMAEELLKEHERELELIYNTSFDAIFLISIEGHYRYKFASVNQAFLSSTRLKKEQVEGKYVEEVIPEPSLSLALSKYQKAISDHQTEQWEETTDYGGINKTGIVTITPVFNEYDECTLLVGGVYDITARKEAEEQLQKSELRYRLLIEQASDAIIIADRQGTLLDVNTSLCEQTGYQRQELLASNISKLIDPEQLKNEPPWLARLEVGQSTQRERRMIRKDGTIIEMEVKAKMLPHGAILAIGRDITEKKEAEAIIQLSYKRLKEAELLGKTGYWLWDVKTGDITWSEGTYRIFDETPVNFKENWKSFEKRIHPEDWKRILGIFEELFKSKKSTRYEFWIRTLTNEDKYIASTAEVILDEKGDILSVFGNTVDLTDRKKAEELIIRERDLSNSIVNSLPGIFYIFNEEGKILRWNKEIEIITGYTAQEIAAMQPLDFFTDDEKDYIIKRIGGVFEHGFSDAGANILTKEKQKIPFYFKAVQINYEDEPCVLGYGIDISGRKKIEQELLESEQKYKLLFEKNPLPMWMFSRSDFSIIDVNEAAIRRYGYSRDEFLQMTIKDLRPPEDIERFLDEVSKSPGTGINRGAWRHKKKDGTVINVEIIGHDIIYKGRHTRLALANDVTEKLIAEENLKQSYNEIRELASHIEDIREEEKIEIAREIHDELGQQLTALKMDMFWISKRIREEDEAIKQKAKGTVELIDETIKTVRRIATELRPGILDDLGLVAALQWQSEEFQKRSGIKIEFGSTIPRVVVAKNIAVGIFRVFQEALTNVLRHANATNVVATFNQENGQFVLKIIDNGKGFEVSKIGSKKTLGLLGMKERTLMMGGKYDVISELGKGTTVVVAVPRQEVL